MVRDVVGDAVHAGVLGIDESDGRGGRRIPLAIAPPGHRRLRRKHTLSASHWRSSTGRKSCSAASFDTLALFRFASVPNHRQHMDLYLVSHLTAINSFVCPALLAVIMSSSCCGQMRVMTLHDFQRCRAAFPAAEAMLPLVLGTVGNQGCIT